LFLQGHWLMEFLAARIATYPELREVHDWIEAHFAVVKTLSTGLRPKAFDTVVSAVYRAGECGVHLHHLCPPPPAPQPFITVTRVSRNCSLGLL
jgi:hypothetical protein